MAPTRQQGRVPDYPERSKNMSLNLRSPRSRRGYTLIEVMIVVLIIDILLAIAAPNLAKARESSRQKACVSNLKQIQSAAEQWAMDKKQTGSATPADTAL